MAQFLPAYNYMMDSEDAQRKYLSVADPVRVTPGDPPDVVQRKQTAQAISGINSYFWAADFARILSCGPAARAYAVQQFYQSKYWTPLLLAQMNDQTVANCVLDDGVNQGDGTIGKLVNDQEFYKNAKLSLQKLDKAADGLEDTGPLSVIGTMAQQFGL